jgi:uncharacterized protein YndB with AHSA1/START domain
MEGLAIERTIWIDAPRERVWAAITDPAQVEQWFSPGTKWETVGEGPGMRLFVRNKETGEEMYTQVTEVFDPPHRLVSVSVATPPDTPHETSWVLEEENGGTRLTMTYSGFEGMSEDQRATFMTNAGMGFTLMLGNIKACIEGTELPNPGGF